MGLDNSTLFIANITIMLVSVAAYAGVWLRARDDRYWLSWIGANLVLASALVIYVSWPDLPPYLAVWPDGILIAGFSLRLAAARQFAGRPAGTWTLWLPAPIFFLIALASDSRSFDYAFVNVILTAQSMLVAHEFWRGREDGLPSRFGLIAVYLLIAVSFAVRAGQGFTAADQIVSYIPDDTLLQIHLIVALVHVAGGSMLVLSLASERGALALREAARRDSLTGLYNRRAFEARLRERLEAAAPKPFAVALLDIDHFKSINDLHGHAAGDAVLKSVAGILADAVRPADFVARIGGEEFAVILFDVEAQEAYGIAERLGTAVRASSTDYNGCRIKITISAGVCHSTAAGPDFDALLEAADRELYRAKFAGRDTTSLVAARPPVADGSAGEAEPGGAAGRLIAAGA
jgi:diguanylate cyclase (GGDEF)-like protein